LLARARAISSDYGNVIFSRGTSSVICADIISIRDNRHWYMTGKLIETQLHEQCLRNFEKLLYEYVHFAESA